MAHIELRDVEDDDLDAVFALIGDPGGAALAEIAGVAHGDRAGFDAWIARVRADSDATLWVVTENGGFAGAAAAFPVGGEREVSYAVASHARGRGVGSATLQLLAGRAPVRPLYARLPQADAPSEAVRERLGFAEVGDPASGPVGRYVLPPTLE